MGLPEHDKHTLELDHEEIHSEASRRSKMQRTTKSFCDKFTIYLKVDSSKTIVEAFSSLDANDWKEAIYSENILFFPMGLGSLLIDHMVANLWVASECLRITLSLMVLLKSTRHDL
jgi:hypothetical protein